MTCYLGPDNPPPLSLISEIHQRSLQVSKITKEDCSLFDLGEKYYSQMCKLLRLQAGINIDDKLCVICSNKSKMAAEIEQRLCLINPVFKLSLGRVLYEEVSKERDINVGMLVIDAEDYFKELNANVKFDKVILIDGLELVEERENFFKNVKNALKDDVDSSLVIIHRTKDILTLPLYIEALVDIEDKQIEVDEILGELLKNEFLVGWNIVSLPINIPKDKWLNQLYNHFPPVLENINLTDVYSGLRQLVETSFKYSDYMVSLKDRFLLLVASSSKHEYHQPYKMHLLDNEIETTSDEHSSIIENNLLRLNITPDIRGYLPKNMNTITTFLEDEFEYPEEWWGTMANIPMVGLDKSRVNRYIQRRYRK